MKWKITPQIGLVIGSSAIVGGLSSVVLFNGIAHGEWDLLGLQQQVQYLTEKTDNHDARISNLETQTSVPGNQPTPAPTAVPAVVTRPAVQSASTTTVAQTPVTATIATPPPTPQAPYIVSYYLVNGGACPLTDYYSIQWSDSGRSYQRTKPTTGTDIANKVPQQCTPGNIPGA